MKEKIYFNFPIILLKDFLSDTPKVMNEIMYYALFNHTNTLRLGSEEDKIEAAYRFFGVTPGDKKLILGKKLAILIIKFQLFLQFEQYLLYYSF